MLIKVKQNTSVACDASTHYRVFFKHTPDQVLLYPLCAQSSLPIMTQNCHLKKIEVVHYQQAEIIVTTNDRLHLNLENRRQKT